MKKFITLALALILTLGMSVATFAVDLNNETLSTDDAVITGTYEVTDAPDTISVTVAWTDAAWTYTVASTWDAENHVDKPNETGTWSNDSGAAATTITLTNNSNVPVTTTYDADAAYDTVTAELAGDTDTAVRAANSTEHAATETVTLTIGGTLDAEGEYTENFTVATVTITVANANA